MIAEQFGQIPMSPYLTAALARAAEYAKAQLHRDVSLEHVLLSLAEDPEASVILKSSNIDIGRLQSDVSAYIGRLDERVDTAENAAGTISADLKRVLEAAAAAAGQGRRREINGAIVLAAIVGDGKSPAAHILRSQGLTFEEAIRALQKTTAPASKPSGSAPRAGTADDILASARERAMTRTNPRLQSQQPVEAAAPAQAPTPAPQPAPHIDVAKPAAELSIPAPAPAPISIPAPAPVAQPPGVTELPAPMPFPMPSPSVPAPAPMQTGGVGWPPFQNAPQQQQQTPPQQMPVPTRSPFPPPSPAQMRPPPPQQMPVPMQQGMPPFGMQPPPQQHQQAPRQGMPSQYAPQQPPPWSAGPPPQHMQPQQQRPSPPYDEAMARLDARRPGGAPPPPARPGAQPNMPGRSVQGAMVQAGQLVENIPRKMKVAIPVIVEARIARADVKALADNLQGDGSVYRHEVTVTKAMSVRLRAPDGGFFIETASPETQWIENIHGLMSNDYASWRWSVTPRDAGKKKLQLVISARTVGADGLAAETALPDQIVDVKVGINAAKTVKLWGGWIAAAIAGGVLARFGEGAFDSVRTLAGF